MCRSYSPMGRLEYEREQMLAERAKARGEEPKPVVGPVQRGSRHQPFLVIKELPDKGETY